MTVTERLNDYVQNAYQTRYGRRIDDITDTDGQEEVDKTINWTNQLLDELELETDWRFAREKDVEIGEITDLAQTFSLPDDVRKLVTNENRPLKIMQDGVPVSYWDVVDPSRLTARNPELGDKRVTYVDGEIVFSRPFNDTELGGTIVADVIINFPRLSRTNVDLLDLVKPKQLLYLGVAKNATLVDIVQGGLSPSFTQKYADLLTKAVAENDAASLAEGAIRDDYSGIGGIY